MRFALALLLGLWTTLHSDAGEAAGREIVIDKSARTLVLIEEGQAVLSFDEIRLGDVPVGHKHFEGDERTPEGRYTVSGRNPESAYHLSLRISYPNDADRAYAAAHGRRPGGDIFIHGQPNDSAQEFIDADWTDGCIALSNDEIEALWDEVDDGTPVTILP
jgi:murein L,D-transpeptidase YafK